MQTNMLMNSQQKKKQHWATEEPNLHNARRLTGIYPFAPEDMEFERSLVSAKKIGIA